VVDYSVAESRTPIRPVTKLQLEITLKQATIIYDALEHARNAEMFNFRAIHSTDDERQEASTNIQIIDQLMGMVR
jgi:hypothetical protein